MASPRVPVRLDFRPRALLLLIGFVLAGYLVLTSLQASVGVLTNLLVAGVVAALLRPFVLALATRMRLGLAVGLVLAAGILVAAGLLVATAFDLNNATSAIAADLRASIDRVPTDSLAGQSIDALDLRERSVDAIENIPTRLVFGSDSPLGGVDRASRALLLFILGFVFVTRGPDLVKGTVGLVRDGRTRSTLGIAVTAAYHVGGAATRRILAVAVLNGLVAGLLAFAIGLPAPLALGLWAAGWSLVPAAGVAIGWAPVVALAFGVGGVAGLGGDSGGILAGLIAVAVLVGVVTGRLWLLRTWVADRTVRVNRVVLAVLFLGGWNLAGMVGGIVGVFLAAAFSAAVAATGSLGTMGSDWLDDGALDSDVEPDGGAVPAERPDGQTAPSPLRRAVDETGVDDTGQPRPVELQVDVSVGSGVLAIAMLAALMIVWYFIFEQSGVGIALLIGFVIALALNPVIERVTRRTGHRQAAITVVVTLFVLAAAAFATFAVPTAVDQARTIPDQVPKLVSQLDDLPLVGPTLANLNLSDRLNETLDELPQTLDSQDTAINSLVSSAGDGLVAALWAFILVVCLLADGPTLLRGLHDAIPARRQPRVEKLSDLAYRSFGRYWGGSVLLAAINAAVVTTVALAASLPMAPILGLWAGMCSLIPQIGGLLGGGALVLIAFAQGLVPGLVVLAVYLVWQTIANNVLLPVVIGKSVQLSPLAAMSVILVGLAVGGVIGAILATPLAGVVKLAYRELGPGADQSQTTPGSDPPPLASSA